MDSSGNRKARNAEGVLGRGLARLLRCPRKAVGKGAFAWLSRLFSPSALVALYRRNSGAGADLEKAKADFSLILRAWGVAEADVDAFARSRRMDALCGLGVGVFGLCSAVLQLAEKSPVSACLSVAASASVGLCGLVFALTSFWRSQVLRSRRFVPFLSWCAGSVCFWRKMR